MIIQLRHLSQAAQALLATGVLLTSALAAPASVEGRAEAKSSRVACPYGTTTPASTRCLTKADLKETGSESAGAERDADRFMRNALLRCDRLSGEDRKDCVARTKGHGTESGSVQGGGIYRELVTLEAAPPKAAKDIEGAAPVVAPK